MPLRRSCSSPWGVLRVDYIRLPGTEWMQDAEHRYDSVDVQEPPEEAGGELGDSDSFGAGDTGICWGVTLAFLGPFSPLVVLLKPAIS